MRDATGARVLSMRGMAGWRPRPGDAQHDLRSHRVDAWRDRGSRLVERDATGACVLPMRDATSVCARALAIRAATDACVSLRCGNKCFT